MGVVIAICITPVVGIFTGTGVLKQRVLNLFTPSEKWGPALPEHKSLLTLDHQYWPGFLRSMFGEKSINKRKGTAENITGTEFISRMSPRVLSPTAQQFTVLNNEGFTDM